jgi:protein ImuA
VHEIYAAEIGDAAAAAGFAVTLATGMAGTDRGTMWLRARRAQGPADCVQANGWAELGGAPGLGLLAVLPDRMALLRAAVDALRSPALGAVIVEGWGAMRELDLTASRRLALAAEKSGVPLLLLRIDARPVPSAAQTRWQVAAAPSRALPGNAPGSPCFDVTLLRQRSGPCGRSWRLEWNRDQCRFREAPLSGAVVPVPADRPAADRASGASREAA